MQFAVVALGHPAVPYVVSVLAIAVLWLWSRGAPPERVVERIVEVERPRPAPRAPIRIDDGEIVWEAQPQNNYMEKRTPRAFCAEHEHQELWWQGTGLALGGTVVRREPISDAGSPYMSTWVPWCVEGDHTVDIADGRTFAGAATRAQGLIETEERKQAAE